MRNPNDYAERLAIMQTAATLMAPNFDLPLAFASEQHVLERAKRAIRVAQIIYAEVVRSDPLDR